LCREETNLLGLDPFLSFLAEMRKADSEMGWDGMGDAFTACKAKGKLKLEAVGGRWRLHAQHQQLTLELFSSSGGTGNRHGGHGLVADLISYSAHNTTRTSGKREDRPPAPPRN